MNKADLQNQINKIYAALDSLAALVEGREEEEEQPKQGKKTAPVQQDESQSQYLNLF